MRTLLSILIANALAISGSAYAADSDAQKLAELKQQLADLTEEIEDINSRVDKTNVIACSIEFNSLAISVPRPIHCTIKMSPGTLQSRSTSMILVQKPCLVPLVCPTIPTPPWDR